MGLSDGQRALHPWVAQGTVPAPDALPDLQLQATLTPPHSKTIAPFLPFPSELLRPALQGEGLRPSSPPCARLRVATSNTHHGTSPPASKEYAMSSAPVT